MYTAKIVAILLKNLDECAWEERIDLSMALRSLDREEKVFLSHVLAGWSLREAGRRIGKPGHTERRYERICRKVSMFLEGGANV